MFYVENSPAPQRFFMADCGLPSKCLHRNLTVALKVKAQRGWSADARSGMGGAGGDATGLGYG